MIDRPALSPVRCGSEHCDLVLGYTDGLRLYLATCVLTKLVTLHCRKCGARRKWEPRTVS